MKDIVANVFTTSNYAFRGIVLLPNGSLCLSEQKSNTLYSLATGGGALTAMKTVTSMEGSLAVGQNVINQGDNVLFVHANNKLFRFNINGLTLTDIDSPGVSFSSTTFGSVYGIFSKPPA
ncbi:MAG: hypothetical protein NTX57_22855 [Armatimonadetes bacterium]|nr:hypothetical protein [Armatimonadota bacterium]